MISFRFGWVGAGLLAAVVSFPVTAWAARASARGAASTLVNDRLLSQQQPVGPASYDSHPVFSVDAEGKGWVVWHGYRRDGEWVIGRPLPLREDAPFTPLSRQRGIVAPSELTVGADRLPAAIWSAWTDGHWRLVGTRNDGKAWSDPSPLFADDIDRVEPVVESLSPGAYAASWAEFRDGRFQVAWCRWETGGAGAAQTISTPGADSFRPQLVRNRQGELWAVWDAYANKNYTVHARRLLPQPGPIEQVSHSPDRCFRPVAMASAAGEMYVVWVRVVDVTTPEGAVDQRHSLQVARRTSAGWQTLADAGGSDDVAVLTSGLLAQVAPEAVPTGGYMGRRRAPMLARDGDALWLLWERKASPAGSTSVVTGDLLGRRIRGSEIGPLLQLAAGDVEYHISQDAEVRDGRLPVMFSSLPRDGRRTYTLTSLSIAAAKPATADNGWAGWSRIALPAPGSEPRRHEISEGGRTYRLFWMDSHVHSGFSADAEGEPDEILFFGRDRGRLDTMVMQENDFFNCPLTDWEYQLGGFYSRALSRDGAFVAMPGYEWTQRVPTDKSLPLDDPRFWSGNYPNHRTVIYPRAGGPLVRYVDVGNDINALYAAVQKAGGVMHTQHPQFDFTGAPPEVAIEVTAGWGLYFLNPGLIHATLNRGYRAAFIGTSDSHRRNPGLGGGLTGIYATELTPDAILEAYRARRVFATNGSRIAIEARANGRLMGQDAPPAKSAHLSLWAESARPLRKATLVRDGVDIKSWPHEGADLRWTVEYEDREAAAGTHWYYWRVEQEGASKHYGGNIASAFGHLGWSSPSWITIQP